MNLNQDQMLRFAAFMYAKGIADARLKSGKGLTSKQFRNLAEKTSETKGLKAVVETALKVVI